MEVEFLQVWYQYQFCKLGVLHIFHLEKEKYIIARSYINLIWIELT